MRAVCANEEPASGFAEYENARGQRDVSLAQQVERTEFNGEVAGSNPSGYQADVLRHFAGVSFAGFVLLPFVYKSSEKELQKKQE